MNSLVSEWMKFRLAFMLDLLTPNDIETDCSCKMGMGAEVRRANIGNMKDVDEWGRKGLFCTDCGNQKEKIERRWRDSEGEINRRQRRLGKKRDDGSVDGIKYVDEEERDRCQKVTSPSSLPWLCFSLLGGMHFHRVVCLTHRKTNKCFCWKDMTHSPAGNQGFLETG